MATGTPEVRSRGASRCARSCSRWCGGTCRSRLPRPRFVPPGPAVLRSAAPAG